MQGCRSPGGLQRFTSMYSTVRNLFAPLRSRRSALATHLRWNGSLQPVLQHEPVR